MKSLRRGESVFRRKGNIVASMWKDKKAVAFISTHCNARGNKTIHRKQKDGTYIEVPSLLVVKPYNQYMGESITVIKCGNIMIHHDRQINGGGICYSFVWM